MSLSPMSSTPKTLSNKLRPRRLPKTWSNKAAKSSVYESRYVLADDNGSVLHNLRRMG
jgi:hypothetical protein